MKKSGVPTKYPGVLKIGNKTYRIRGKAIDPRTGKPEEVDWIVDNVTVQQAARIRAELLEQLRRSSADLRAQRVRVGEYAQLWMRSKASKIEPHTAESTRRPLTSTSSRPWAISTTTR